MDFATSWKHMGTLGRIEAIRAVWVDGCSASQIAATFKGVSRNAVIGVYHRFGKEHLADMPLRGRSPINKAASDKRKRAGLRWAPPRDSAPAVSPVPRPEPRFEPNEYHLAGKPLMMLKAKECRFSVNNAEGDELHLFCGRPAERSYCAHHQGRAYRSVER